MRTLSGIDRLEHAIRVLRHALDLRHDRLNRLADLGQVLQRHIDIGGVVGQGLGEDVGVVKRRLNGIGIVGEKLVGAIDNRDALRRHGLDVADDRANLVGVDRLEPADRRRRKGLQARGQRPDLLADFAHALQRRVDSGRIVGQRLRKLIDVRERRMDRRGIFGDDLVGVVQNRGGLDREGGDAVQNVLQLHRLFGVDHGRRPAILGEPAPVQRLRRPRGRPPRPR